MVRVMVAISITVCETIVYALLKCVRVEFSTVKKMINAVTYNITDYAIGW